MKNFIEIYSENGYEYEEWFSLFETGAYCDNYGGAPIVGFTKRGLPVHSIYESPELPDWVLTPQEYERMLRLAKARYLEGRNITKTTHAIGDGEWSIELFAEESTPGASDAYLILELVGSNGTRDNEESDNLHGDLVEIEDDAWRYACHRKWALFTPVRTLVSDVDQHHAERVNRPRMFRSYRR